ncbi:MAG: hypothetical protein ACXWP4_13530 [Polyangiales bacterium]
MRGWLALGIALVPLAAQAQVPSASVSAKPAASLAASASTKPSVSVSGSISAAASASAPPLGSAAGEMPPGHPPITDDQPLPPGHPPMGEDEEQGMPKVPRDEVHDDKTIPAGVIVVTIKDEADKPIADQLVNLGIMRQSVAEGESRSRTTGTTDANGDVKFTGLKFGTGWAYRVSVVASAPGDPDAMATYGAEPFNLPLDHGFRVVLHRFPVSGSIDKLLAAVEGVDTIIELRDDVIEVQQIFDVINAGTTTWALGKGLMIALPKGFKGLRTGEAMEDHQVTPVEGEGAKWTGSFPPGRSRIAYEFKVPYEGEPKSDFDIALPPRVLAARVRIATKKGMTLAVDGFPAAHEEPTGSGVKVLSTVKQGSPSDEVRMLRIHIGGIPTEGPERWIAIVLGFLGLAGGLYMAVREPPTSDRRATASSRERRRQAFLSELVALEKAHQAGDVGPKAYARERQKLVDAIADTLDPEESRAGEAEPAS